MVLLSVDGMWSAVSVSEAPIYQEMAIAALGARDLAKMKSLQNFLSAIPHAKHRQQILLGAIFHYAALVAEAKAEPTPNPQQDAQTVLDWAIANPSAFHPDLNLMKWAKRRLYQLIAATGSEPRRDFEWTQSGIKFSQTCRETIEARCQSGELTLIRQLIVFEIF